MNKEKYIYQEIKLLEHGFPIKVMSNYQSGAPLHWHEYFEVLYFIKGEAELVCGSEKYTGRPGDFFIINSNELHSITGDSVNHLHICLQIAPQFFSDVEFDNYIFKPYIQGDEQIREYIEKIVGVWEAREPAYDIEVKSITYSLIAYLIRNYVTDLLSDSATQMRRNKLKTINEIVMHISQNYHTHMTTSSLAEEFHLTEQYFCNIFKKATGQTPIDYINSKRSQKAGVLLKTTDQSITDIALAVGFDSSHYFTRVFKKYMGLSPREYRKG